MTTSVTTEIAYWDKAAIDPDVDIKYIADVDTDECLAAIAPVGQNIHESTASILDLGCGVGRLAVPIARQFIDYTVVGVDISPKMIALANKRFKANRVKFAGAYVNNFKALLGNGRTIPLDDKSFAGAYSMLLFQHLDPETVQGYIKEVYRVLKRGSCFRFQYVEGDYHGELDHNYSQTDMRRWLADNNFTIKKVEGGLIHPLWTWITAVKDD